MWKALWKKWTIDRPAAFGDLLWDVFVVQFATYLNKLTLRRVIALISIVILILAYDHKIPISPTLMLVGDLLAYMDIFTAIFLIGILTRATTMLFVARQAMARVARLLGGLQQRIQRLDFRHRREGGARNRKRLTGRNRDDDGEDFVLHGAAWA
jgi:hypothetical protein